MLQARQPTPKLATTTNNNNNQQSAQLSNFTSAIGRSRSSVSLAYLSSKIQQIEKNTPAKQVKQFTRVQSAFKKKYQQSAVVNGISRVVNVNVKGKLHLGKIAKPGIILNSQARNNPWAKPNPISENIINKRGLMDMVNMGMIPKNADFTDLLNHRYQQIKQPIEQIVPQVVNKQPDNFFATNPGLVQEVKQKIEQMGKTEQQLKKSNEAGQKNVRKKVKKGSKTKKQQLAFVIPPEPVILQIINQRVLKNEKYTEQVKKARKTGDELAFLYFVKKVQEFAQKYNLKKFQIKLVLDETRKLSDLVIRQNILNAKALGICLAVKGSLNKRVYEVARMFAVRFKFKKSRRDLLKIQNIKRYFRIKKFYVQMTRKRCDLLKFKLGSFAERQRRFIQQANERNGISEHFRVQIHLLPISAGNYEQERSYYKIECRNNIQLTRIFSQQPQNLIIMTEQQNCDFSSWLSLVNKIPGYHPNISIMFSNFRNYKVTSIDSIYYGISPEVIQKVRNLCGKKGDSCIYPSCFKGTLVKICQAFNAKLYSSSFYKPYLDKLLEEEDDDQVDLKIFEEYLNQGPVGSNQKISLTSQAEQTSRSAVSNVSLELIKSRINLNSLASGKNYTQARIKHVITKAKTKQLNLYQISGEHFSNKLVIKRDILLAFKQETPYSIIFQPMTAQTEFLKRLTQNILEFKNVNKWVFKIGIAQRFSRGLAFLQTDSLKILKQKKKKSYLSQADLHQVASIMKIILLDKLQIPQSSLHESSEYLAKFIKYGGYVQAVLTEASTECIFGKVSVTGNFEILGTFSKIYTDQIVNCAGLYPSQNLTAVHFEAVKHIVSQIFAQHQLFGYITLELLIDKRTHKHYFIDMQFTLQQYSSLHFMYRSIFNNLKSQAQESLTILRKLSKNKVILPPNSKTVSSKAKVNNVLDMLNSIQNKQKIEQEKQASRLEFPRQIVYIPFIDNNGNVYNTFQDFDYACQEKNLKMLNFESGEGMRFLYLNLKQQKPDVLSLLVFSRSQRRALKYALDGLNFLTQSGEKTNKFDKKVQRRNYDCLYIHDIIWKLREIKKQKDSEAHTNTSNALDKQHTSQFQPVI